MAFLETLIDIAVSSILDATRKAAADKKELKKQERKLRQAHNSTKACLTEEKKDRSKGLKQ